jgi:hypothetical protein
LAGKTIGTKMRPYTRRRSSAGRSRNETRLVVSHMFKLGGDLSMVAFVCVGADVRQPCANNIAESFW